MSYRLRFYAGLAADSLGALISVPLECDGPDAAAAVRQSPRGALRFTVGDGAALLCYGRPSARGRRVFGGLVPYGELWRLGANEPTVLHLPFAASVAGIRVRKGKLAIYAVPQAEQWTVVLNRSTRQWGLTRPERGRDGRLHPSAYTTSVMRAEIGRTVVQTSSVPHVEQLAARAEVIDDRCTHLVLEWETVSVSIPIET
jgi:hypothetical protein